MEVEVQRVEYSRDGWLHFLITRFLVFPIEPWAVFNYNKGCARHVFREYKMKKTLKVLSLLLSITAMTTFSSCSKDSEELILGEWICYKEEGVTDYEPYMWEPNIPHTFNEDGTVDILLDGTHEWYIIGDTLYIDDRYYGEYFIEELTSSSMIYHGGGEVRNCRRYFKRK